MADKIYIGNGKKVETRFDSELFNVLVCLDKIPEDQIFVSEKTGKKYLRVYLAEMRREDDYGNTHTAYIDTWKPESNGGGRKASSGRTGTNTSGNEGKRNGSPSREEVPGPEDFYGDDIPF